MLGLKEVTASCQIIKLVHKPLLTVFSKPVLLAGSLMLYRPESGINPLSQLCIQTEISHVKDKILT